MSIVEQETVSEHITEWLERVEKKIDRLGAVPTQIAALDERLAKHDKLLYGNGQPGLLADVDRLKQSRKLLMWAVGIVIAAAAAEMPSVFRSILTAVAK
jgi:hypothetical protein